MATTFVYKIGPHYCPHCGKFTLHTYEVYKPMDYCTSVFMLPFFYASIKKHFVCCACQTKYPLDAEKKRFFELFKKSGLFVEKEYEDMLQRVGEVLSNFDTLHLSMECPEMKEAILQVKEKVFWKYKLPEEWYENTCYFALDALQEKYKMDERLFGKL